jgi:hypothetical protein
MANSIFTSNTYPLGLKVFRQEKNTIDYYLLSNTNYQFSASAFTYSGYDLLNVTVLSRMNLATKVFSSYTTFTSGVSPSTGDIWALGEIDVNNVFLQKSDKLFKVDELTILTEGKVNITATEYESSMLSAVDNAAISATSSTSLNLNYVTPPPPVLSLRSIPAKTKEGTISYSAVFNASVDSSNYNVPVTTVINYGAITNIIDVLTQG